MTWRTSRRNFCGGTTIIALYIAARWRIAVWHMREGWPGNGGSAPSFDPDRDVLDAPAFWDETLAGSVVTLGAAPPHLADTGSALTELQPVATWSDGASRHMVIDANGHRHRILLWRAVPTQPLAILLPPTCDIARIAAAEVVRALLAGCPSRGVVGPGPSAFQRQRLALLVKILDAVLAGQTVRTIGTTLVAPRLAGIGAAAWKASSERRRVQRLIGEANALMRGGYRALLGGGSAAQVGGGDN
jgi:hypothetical protein